jgi:peptidoglycan-N-acetylglucosamine deacetylase
VEANRGGIVLFHDTRAQTVAMPAGFLRALKNRGYRLVYVVPAAEC